MGPISAPCAYFYTYWMAASNDLVFWGGVTCFCFVIRFFFVFFFHPPADGEK